MHIFTPCYELYFGSQCMRPGRSPNPGEVWRHFKGKDYRIIAIANHTETKETFVVYEALYAPYGTYVRPLDMFVSKVDRERYPDVKQKYRFMKVTYSENA